MLAVFAHTKILLRLYCSKRRVILLPSPFPSRACSKKIARENTIGEKKLTYKKEKWLSNIKRKVSNPFSMVRWNAQAYYTSMFKLGGYKLYYKYLTKTTTINCSSKRGNSQHSSCTGGPPVPKGMWKSEFCMPPAQPHMKIWFFVGGHLIHPHTKII